MKIVGIILIALQVFGIFGSVVSGAIASTFAIAGVVDVFRLIGYFLPTIIGVILLKKAAKKNKK